jgi:hypothetical protein
MAVYSKIDGENVMVAGYEPFQLNDDVTTKDYDKAMSNGKVQDLIATAIAPLLAEIERLKQQLGGQ